VSDVRFFSPSPLWDDLVSTPVPFRAPAVLRFAGDDFVPQYQGVLETEPRRLRGFVARPESWRAPAVGLDAPASTLPLRLYQPVHGRFYMVAASLACRVPGLPEHTVDTGKGEEVAFVLRRLTTSVDAQRHETETGEWAWVKRADGTEGWVRASGAALAVDEERIPMFASTYAGAGGLRNVPMRRRVFAGLIPASRRESYANAGEVRETGATPPPAPGSLDDPRVIEFQRLVMDPWTELKEWYDARKTDDVQRPDALLSAEQSSALLLIDLYDYLRGNLPAVANAVDGAAGSLGAGQPLFAALAGLTVYDRFAVSPRTLVDALRNAAANRAAIEAGFPAGTAHGYAFPVLVGDPRDPSPAPPVNAVSTAETKLAELLGRTNAAPWELTPAEVPGGLGVRVLKKLVMDALAAAGPAPAVLPEQLPARRPAATPTAETRGEDWFVVRCVYLRPNCGSRSPPVVSERSERFQLTSFFEPDAPARHLRVALPVDTSPATLRKYNRNVAFVLSDQLRKQMSRASSLKDLMDGKAGSEGGGLDFGVICSFSIPIITICALILLMILVSLLNIIFWWIPLFKICFPVPKKA